MKDLMITQLIKKFKIKHIGDCNINQKIIFDKNSINTVDISIPIIIPNSLLFKSITETNIKTQKQKKQIHKTNELYYGNGILGNLFGLNDCDYNWVLSFVIIKQYGYLFTNTVKGFHIGFGNGCIITGLKYFLQSMHEFDWIGIDKNTENQFVLSHQENIVNGFVCNDLLLDCNLKHAQLIINNKFNNVNLITNNITPTHKKNKIMISLAILSIKILSPDGFLLSRITSPEYWDKYMLHYLLLFGMIFKNTEIIRYPICKNKRVKYRYYIMCYNKKQILHSSVIHRRLTNILKNNSANHLEFLQNIMDTDEIKEWQKKIVELQYFYNNSIDSPQVELNNIISDITDWFELNKESELIGE
jgi:hypothetical protein